MTPGRADTTPIAALCLPALDIVTPVILSRICTAIRDAGCGAVCDTAQIVLAEALNNVAEHAYPARALGAVTVFVEIKRNTLRLQITDWGAPVPTERLTTNEPPDPLSMAEGGYGWFLIRSLVTDLSYDRRGCRNDLTLILDLCP